MIENIDSKNNSINYNTILEFVIENVCTLQILAEGKNNPCNVYNKKTWKGKKKTRREIHSEVGGRKSVCFKTKPVVGSYELDGNERNRRVI